MGNKPISKWIQATWHQNVIYTILLCDFALFWGHYWSCFIFSFPVCVDSFWISVELWSKYERFLFFEIQGCLLCVLNLMHFVCFAGIKAELKLKTMQLDLLRTKVTHLEELNRSKVKLNWDLIFVSSHILGYLLVKYGGQFVVESYLWPHIQNWQLSFWFSCSDQIKKINYYLLLFEMNTQSFMIFVFEKVYYQVSCHY